MCRICLEEGGKHNTQLLLQLAAARESSLYLWTQAHEALFNDFETQAAAEAVVVVVMTPEAVAVEPTMGKINERIATKEQWADELHNTFMYDMAEIKQVFRGAI
jgi:hypothetical protein